MEIRQVSRYNYPDNLDLRPRGELSTQICARVIQNATNSHDFMEKKYNKWREIDRKNHAYIPADELEIQRRAGSGAYKGDPRAPMSFVLPYSFAVKKSLLAHLTNRNLRGPLHKLTGHGLHQDMLAAEMIAVVINQEANYWDAARYYHNAYNDTLDYGLCFVACNWDTEWAKVSRRQPMSTPAQGMFPVEQFRMDWEMRMEGSRLANIDVFRALPDCAVALEDVDKSQRFYYLDQEGMNSLIAKDGREEYFNVDHLRNAKAWKSTFQLHNSNRGYIRNVYGDSTDMSPNDDDVRDIYEMHHPVCIKGVEWIIPREFPGNGLAVGESSEPQLYEFTIAADEYILQFNPVGANHGMIPIATAGLNTDGYSLTPTSPMELLLGSQEYLDWSINTYVTEVMSNVNGNWIYDPLVIREDDVNSKVIGKKMRLRQRYWGQGKLKEAFHQLQGSTAAQTHIANIPLIQDMMNRGAGASEILQGVMRAGGERRSATESESVKEMGLGRVDEMSFLLKILLHKRLTKLYAENTIQFKSQGGWYRAVDDWPEALREEFGSGPIYIDPREINVPYDVLIEEDADSMGSEASTALINQMLNIALTSEHPSMQQVDPIQWMKLIMRRSGERNVQKLFKAPQVMDDEQLMRQEEAGDMVPMEQAIGGGDQLALPA